MNGSVYTTGNSSTEVKTVAYMDNKGQNWLQKN